MRASYHVHSLYSDGQTNIKELVEYANVIGLDEIGISDHFVVTPTGIPCSWSMPLEDLSKYLDEIEDSKSIARSDLKVLKGLEADYFPETISTLQEITAPYQLDYIIGSVHFVDGFPVDERAENWERLTQSEVDNVIRAYWSRITGMAKTGFYSFAGHLDLYKKFGFGPSIDISRDIEETLDAIAASGMAVEINTAGFYMMCQEPYPSHNILMQCKHRNIPILVTADAHNPANLTRSYEQGNESARTAGFEVKSFWTPEKRKKI